MAQIATTIEQSKKLIELGLDVNTADMWYVKDYLIAKNQELDKPSDNEIKDVFPAWSLSALLDILPFPQLSKDKLGSGKVGWMVSVYPDNCRYDSCWHNNPIDAAFEMMVYVLENKNPKSKEEQIKELADLKRELLNSIK